MHIVFIGPPGAGKGTQAQRLADHLKMPHLSTGQMLRDAIAAGTPLGKQAAQWKIEEGRLVPDETMIEIIGARLREPDCASGCLFDGFPRTIRQAHALDRRLEEDGRTLDAALELQVEEEELMRRLLRRAKESASPRADDTPDTIPKRLALYHAHTAPVSDYYRQQGRLHAIDGHGSPEEVFARIRAEIDAARR